MCNIGEIRKYNKQKRGGSDYERYEYADAFLAWLSLQ